MVAQIHFDCSGHSVATLVSNDLHVGSYNQVFYL